MGHKKVARLPFCTCPVILSGVSTLVYILRRVFEQLANSCAVTMLWYTGCNVVIVMAATAWLMMSFSSCIVCGFDLYTVLSKCPQRKFLPSSRGGGGRNLKNTVYESNPHTIQELKHNISHAVAAIKITMLHRVYLNIIRHAQLFIDAGGNHLQHL